MMRSRLQFLYSLILSLELSDIFIIHFSDLFSLSYAWFPLGHVTTILISPYDLVGTINISFNFREYIRTSVLASLAKYTHFVPFPICPNNRED